jgi:hypothetical protein
MKTIQQLVDGGYTQAAFKYKANANKFIDAWKRKGYYCEWLFSSGAVTDVAGQPHVRDAYYCICTKKPPKPPTAKERRWYAEQEKTENLIKNNPRAYWEEYAKKRVMKHADPEIKELVLDLNRYNQFTTDSCAGHGNEPGSIFFDGRNLDGWKVREIMKKHGLTGIRKRERYLMERKYPVVVYEFDPVGKPKRR